MSGLSRRSSSTRPASPSIRTSMLERDAVGQARVRVVRASCRGACRCGSLLDRLIHASLAVVEPLADDLADHVDAVVGAQLLEAPLGDARRAEAREVVAVPLVRHADAAPAHADDVVDVLVVALDAHARERERALVVDVLGARHVRRRQRVAAVGLVGLGDRREQVLARRRRRGRGSRGRPSACCRGRGRCAGTRRPRARSSCSSVMASARYCEPMMCTGRPSAEASSSLSAVTMRAGEVARLVDDGRARGAQERVRHLAADAVEPVGDDGQQDRVERLRCSRCSLRSPLGRFELPGGAARARAGSRPAPSRSPSSRDRRPPSSSAARRPRARR